MKKITIVLALLLSFFANAQRTCSMQEKMDAIMADPVLRVQYLEQQARFEVELNKLNNLSARTAETSSLATIRIPVAVHFPEVSSASSAATKNCLIALAQNQVNILNADYNGINADLSLWNAASIYYPGVNTGSLDVQFVIATQNHPVGTGLTNGQVAVTFGTSFLNGDDNDFNWAGYMNFVVRNEGNSILGYSPLGGIPNQGATVVINRFCFGSGTGCTSYQPSSPFNKGRTLTHELGHFFNLNHTFGSCGTNCNTTGDRVCDTPAVFNESYNCPSPGSVSGCVSGQNALTMNYMDYVDDACMYMFTQGQTTRMLAWYNFISSQFTTNALSNSDFVKNNYTLAPNPSNGTFTLTFKDLSNDVSVEVFDVTGRVVAENYFTQTSNLVQEIKIDNPSAGMYFVNVKIGSAISTEKIIIK